MTKQEFNEEWFDIVKSNIMMIRHFENFIDIPLASDEIYLTLENIFSLLRKISVKTFYTNKSIERIYLLVSPDIDNIHDILCFLTNDELVLTYSIIFNVFEDLIYLTEELEKYEIAGNLLKIRDYWFNERHIKIATIKNVKQK